jgi:excisionase family DNA binding protein
MKELLTTTEAAKRRGVTRQAIDLAIRRGEIRALRAGRYRLIRPKDADGWNANRAAQERGRTPKTK